MWLINCRTLLLEDFLNHKEVRYAILSHTWEKGEEVQFSEFRNREVTGKAGWRKIQKICHLALNDGCEFAWVDTCCIDKSSSAELTEAINSMFPWYAGSEICYTYLADYDASDPEAKLSESRWFTRGWTLQELIAPARIHFYDKSWSFIGTKEVLSQQLALITGVGHEVLLASKGRNLEDLLDQLPVARKMSWAAERETTRTEDTAYCLLGIFGVNLPLLYGEGDQAFIRLQEEVLKTKNDLSLLAWKFSMDETHTNFDRYCGVFAQRPRNFQASGELSLINDIRFSPDFTMTNKGLKIFTQLQYDGENDLHLLELNCYVEPRPHIVLGIFLKHQGASVYARAKPHLYVDETRFSFKTHSERTYFFLSKSISPSIANSLHRVHRSSFRVHNDMNIDLLAVRPQSLWDSARGIFITHGLREFVGIHEYSFESVTSLGHAITMSKSFRGARFFVVFGFGNDFGFGVAPWARITITTTDLQEQIECEDWKQVAWSARRTGNSIERLYVGHSYGTHSYFTIKLEEIIDHGEKAYVVRLGYEVEPLWSAVLLASNQTTQLIWLFIANLHLSQDGKLSRYVD